LKGEGIYGVWFAVEKLQMYVCIPTLESL